MLNRPHLHHHSLRGIFARAKKLAFRRCLNFERLMIKMTIWMMGINMAGSNDKNDDDCKNGDRQDRVTRMCEDGCNLNN